MCTTAITGSISGVPRVLAIIKGREKRRYVRLAHTGTIEGPAPNWCKRVVLLAASVFVCFSFLFPSFVLALYSVVPCHEFAGQGHKGLARGGGVTPFTSGVCVGAITTNKLQDARHGKVNGKTKV